MKKQKKFQTVFIVFVFLLLNLLAIFCLWGLIRQFNVQLLLLALFFILASVFIGRQLLYFTTHMDYEQEIIEAEKQIQENNRREMEREQESLGKLEQEVSRYMGHIEELLEQAAVEETKEYTQNILAECNKKKWQQMCNRPLLDAVLHSKRQFCDEQGIEFDVMSYVPENMVCTESEMISIFHNLLNNAIEACVRMGRNEKRRVFFRTGVRNGQFVLSCLNTRKKKERFTGKTWKKNSALHGMGQKIVYDIVRRHQGNCVCDKKKDTYSMVITFNLSEEAAE